jgi:hypothetical protein
MRTAVQGQPAQRKNIRFVKRFDRTPNGADRDGRLRALLYGAAAVLLLTIFWDKQASCCSLRPNFIARASRVFLARSAGHFS